MMGEILAAHASWDAERLLARLARRGALSARRADEVGRRVAAGEGLAEILFAEVDDQLLLELLAERFRENLLDFLDCAEPGEFEPMEGIFVDNIQVGHDTRALLAEADAAGAVLRKLKPRMSDPLAPGRVAPTGEFERRLVLACTPSASASALVAQAAEEPSRVLLAVAAMLDRGVLASVEVPAPVSTEPLRPAEARPAPPPEPARRPPQEPSFDDEMSMFEDHDREREGGEFTTERHLLDRVEILPDLAPRFKTPAPAEPAPPPETPIEMEDAESAPKELLAAAISLNFAGPKLEEEDARGKVEVCNEVLVSLARRLDAKQGGGMGQTRIQLLVEGTPSAYATLYKSVEAADDGRLPAGTVLRNLRRRPASEHRRLLNRGLGDLIERALGVASEELDEAELEAMLQEIGGYQQRLGV
jgi:hypothetical protein